MAKILVIDDERQVRDSLAQILSKAGHEVQTAQNGEEGLTRFNSWPADLVITDILMPDKDGYDTIRELVAKKPGLPIIAISGGATSLKKEFGLEAAQVMGAVQVLSKPFSRAEVVAAVEANLKAQ